MDCIIGSSINFNHQERANVRIKTKPKKLDIVKVEGNILDKFLSRIMENIEAKIRLFPND